MVFEPELHLSGYIRSIATYDSNFTPPHIKLRFKKFDIYKTYYLDFEKYVCVDGLQCLIHVLEHEYIHYVLCKEISRKASKQFDNIAQWYVRIKFDAYMVWHPELTLKPIQDFIQEKFKGAQ